jgi:hypothetical protein
MSAQCLGCRRPTQPQASFCAFCGTKLQPSGAAPARGADGETVAAEKKGNPWMIPLVVFAVGFLVAAGLNIQMLRNPPKVLAATNHHVRHPAKRHAPGNAKGEATVAQTKSSPAH